MDANKIIVKDSSIFSQNFSEKIIDETVHLINEISYVPDQTVYEYGND